MIPAPDPVPAPVEMDEAEAITTLRTIARLHGGRVIRLYLPAGYSGRVYQGSECVGYAVTEFSAFGIAWNDQPSWVFDRATQRLGWCPPMAVSRGRSGHVTWRGIDDPGAP